MWGLTTKVDAIVVAVYILDTGIYRNYNKFPAVLDKDSNCHIDLVDEGNILNDGSGHG